MSGLLSICAITGILLCAACKDDPAPVDPCNNFNLAVALQAESNAVSAAATAFGLDPTTANCNAFRAAYLAYIEAAQGYQSCANSTGQGAEYQQALADAQAEIDSLMC